MNPGIIVRPAKVDDNLRFDGMRIPLRTASAFRTTVATSRRRPGGVSELGNAAIRTRPAA